MSYHHLFTRTALAEEYLSEETNENVKVCNERNVVGTILAKTIKEIKYSKYQDQNT